MNVIEINNLTYGYDTPILNNISLTACEGDFISIIGSNGAGKSTLIKCICRICENAHGISIFGKPLSSYKQSELSKLVGYVPQSDGRLLNFTAKQFVLMSRYAYVKPFASLSKTDYEAAEKAMELTNTTKYADRLISKMSGGERQKVLIASALAQEAKILLLDEPTTFLDPKHQASVMNIIREINQKENITILMVTHDLNAAIIKHKDINSNNNRIVAIKSGIIAFDGHVDEFVNTKVAEKIFDTEFIYTKDENNQTYIFPKI